MSNKIKISKKYESFINVFVKNIKLLFKFIGADLFVNDEAPVTKKYFIKKDFCNVSGYYSNNGFVMLKGSVIRDGFRESFTYCKNEYKLREELINKKIIVDNVLTQNYEFSSPWVAGTISIGGKLNNINEWKTNNDIKEVNDENSIMTKNNNCINENNKKIQKEITNEYYFIKNNYCDVVGYHSKNGFTILKGSTIRNDFVSSFKHNCKAAYIVREGLINKEIIKNNVFTQDYEFKSFWIAGVVALGRMLSSASEWKRK